MAEKLHRLTVKQVAAFTAPGRYADGGGLYLKVRPGGSRQWVFLYAQVKAGRRVQTEVGFGGAGPGGLSLVEARQKAEEARRVRTTGDDPLHRRKAAEAEAMAASTTFGQFADAYVRSHRAGWSNPKHAAQWAMTLGDAYCKSLRAKAVADIDAAAVLAVLEPVWQAKPETARRVRMRIEKVLDAARVKGLRTGENPARWRGNLDHLLPRHGKTSKAHHAAMAYADVPAFLTALDARPGTAALALRFLILTAARTGEVLGARWSELDLTAGVWTVPAGRMKARRPHRVPLPAQALAVLAEAQGLHPDVVFPRPDLDGPLSGMALLMLLRRMGRDEVTAHGFRSSFRDWAAEETSFAREVAEMALAHAVENDTEAAYRRGDLFEKRRKLMEAWAAYCAPASGGNVVRLTRRE